MTAFEQHTIESAPADSRPRLEQVQKAYGKIPNLAAVFAESPAILEAYFTLTEIFEGSSAFTATERQTALLATSFENECDYCMASHSVIAKMQGVPADVIEALRNGEPLPDRKLEALRTFTRTVVNNRGWVKDADVEVFLEAGYSRRHLLEVILGIALKTLSNYTNHIAETPLDNAFRSQAWTRPAEVSAA